jgi:hypothetical protein
VACEMLCDTLATNWAIGLIDNGILGKFPCHIVYLFL